MEASYVTISEVLDPLIFFVIDLFYVVQGAIILVGGREEGKKGIIDHENNTSVLRLSKPRIRQSLRLSQLGLH